ncbi:NADPH dehydrogenase NamA [Lysinibacillus sp. NPDC097279]|uniref:NADPH dehydrogenase NamA n=1 Tax=Lysinibacillus sp. NPDC097279 TaxID=3364143 RepID=UPI003802B61B
MNTKLFSPYTMKDVTFKNRIVMAPMGTNSSFTKDGIASKWHLIHYGSRAVGQVGLIIMEATSVSPEGHSDSRELGIWSDNHKQGLKEIVDIVHENGSKIGIQLGHTGGKSQQYDTAIAPSAIEYRGNKPREMTKEDIKFVVNQYKKAASRAKDVGFDVIEIHAAHGYLINQFLSPITNFRTDEYGGNIDNRFLFLEEVIKAIKSVWQGPLFVRISADEYHVKGNTIETHVVYAKKMKNLGVDLIDCSSGGVVSVPIDTYPGYQIPASEQIRKRANIATGAVGLITTGIQAEEILKNERADLIFIGRELLRNPYWTRNAAIELNTIIKAPDQYQINYGATWFTINN